MSIDEQGRSNLLARSRFRSRFKLDAEDQAYIVKTGIEKIRTHAFDLISRRLAPAKPNNDGRQTPFRGHPVFKAQHATATCCRGCLAKWYNIPKGIALTEEQIDYIVTNVLMSWIKEQQKAA